MSVDELGDFGMERMDDDQISGFLASQATGVLGLPSSNGPYLLPLTYGYDGDSRLFFTYVLGDSSRKSELTERADHASFLVYKADTMFSWESVLLSGTIDKLQDEAHETAIDALSDVWRPDIFRSASGSLAVELYQFQIDDRAGIKHTGLPPEFEK